MKYISYVIVLLMALSLVTTGCGSSKTEKEMNNETDTVAVVEETETEVDEVDVTEDEEDDSSFSGSFEEDGTKVNIKGGNDVVWPDDIPDYFPKLSGVLTGVLETSDDITTSYTLTFENIISNDFDEFKKMIEEIPGWNIIVQTNTNDGWAINAMHQEKAANLTVTVDKDNSGGMHIMFKE